MMQICPTNLSGVYEIKNRIFKDARGEFIKTFHWDTFKENGLETIFKESFYSTSRKNVLRGMHYQKSASEHVKLVYVTEGKILDVVLNIQHDSPEFGQYYTTELSHEHANALYINKGYAHGFLTLSDTATVIYMTSTIHSPKDDTGIRWDSFGFNWNNINPIISERDKKLPEIHDIKS